MCKCQTERFRADMNRYLYDDIQEGSLKTVSCTHIRQFPESKQVILSDINDDS